LITKKATVAEINDPNLGALLITNSPILNEKGELIGAVHVARDISELKGWRGNYGEKGKFWSLLQKTCALDL